MGKHIHIDWKSNLKFIMKNDYSDTKRCELGIGKFSSLVKFDAKVFRKLVLIKYKCLVRSCKFNISKSSS